MRRFRISTLLLLIAIIAIVCGWLLDRSAQQKKHLAEVAVWQSTRWWSLESIEKELPHKTDLEFVETPLRDALTYIGDKHKIDIQYDGVALREAKIDPTAISVSLNVHGVNLKAALRMILQQHKLAFIVEDEVLKIVPQTRADKYFTTTVYDVRELVPQADEPSISQLVKTITETIEPASWKINGGTGSIQPFVNKGTTSLVVLQNPAGHEQISTLLGHLDTE